MGCNIYTIDPNHNVNDKDVEVCGTNKNTQTSYTVMYIQI